MRCSISVFMPALLCIVLGGCEATGSTRTGTISTDKSTAETGEMVAITTDYTATRCDEFESIRINDGESGNNFYAVTELRNTVSISYTSAGTKRITSYLVCDEPDKKYGVTPNPLTVTITSASNSAD